MFILYIIMVVFCGLMIGSFITAISFRIANNEKVFVARSKCDLCAVRIPYIYLLPVLGYILCKGVCKKCNKKVSYEYTLWELLHAVLYTIVYIMCGDKMLLFCSFAVFTSILFMITIIDIKTQYVYDIHIILLLFAIILILYQTKSLHIGVWSFILALLPLFFKYVYETTRTKVTGQKIEIIGMGDIKIFIILFFLLDLYIILQIVMISGLLGTVHGLLLRKKNTHYAFLPSVSSALYAVFIYNFI